MALLNKIGYDPLDDDDVSGYRRPPMEPACVCDYFAQLMGIEDDGQFMHSEMAELLDNPPVFCRAPAKPVDPEVDKVANVMKRTSDRIIHGKIPNLLDEE